MLVKYSTLWLLTLPLSPCNLFMYYLLIISGLFTLALAGDIACFIYRVHNVVFNACMYTCMYVCIHACMYVYMHVCMYVMYAFVCIPHRDIYHIIIELCQGW